MVGIILIWMFSPVTADDMDITRSMPSSVYSSAEFNVQLDISGLEAGGIVETLPEGYSYAGSALPEERIKVSGQNVIISVIGNKSVTYRVKAPSYGSGTFKGIWYDCLGEVEGTIEKSDIEVKFRSDSGDDDSPSSSFSSGVSPAPTTDKDGLSLSSDGLIEKSVVITSDDHLACIILSKGVNATNSAGENIRDISIKSLKSGEIPPSGHDTEFNLTDHACECSPSGASFVPGIDLVFNLSEEEWKSGAGSEFTVRYFSTQNRSWETVETVTDQMNQTVTAHITHFSIFALFERIPAVADGNAPSSEMTAQASQTSVAASNPEVPAEDDTEDDESGSGFMSTLAAILFVLLVVGCGMYVYCSRNETEESKRQ